MKPTKYDAHEKNKTSTTTATAAAASVATNEQRKSQKKKVDNCERKETHRNFMDLKDDQEVKQTSN